MGAVLKNFFFCIVLLVLMFGCGYLSLAHANGDDDSGGASSATSSSTSTSGSSSTSGANSSSSIGDIGLGGVNVEGASTSFDSKTFALGRSSFDVDINDCRESTAWDTPVYGRQGVRLNPWCAAEVYDAKGMFLMAALMRCDIKEIRQHFEFDEDCVTANTTQPFEVTASPVFAETQHRLDEYEDEGDELRELLKHQAQEIDALQQQSLRRSRAPAQIVQQPYLSDDKKSRLADLMEEK